MPFRPNVCVLLPAELQDRQEQLRERRAHRVQEVAPRLELAARLAGEHDGHLLGDVPALAHLAAVVDEAVVEQRARALVRRLELVEQVRELAHEVRHELHLDRGRHRAVVAVVRDAVVIADVARESVYTRLS